MLLLGQNKPTAKTNILSKTLPSISNIHIRRVLVQDKAYIE